LYTFNAATGGSIWNASTSGFIESSPALAYDVIYVGSGDGKLYAFNASTGAKLWLLPAWGSSGLDPLLRMA